MTVATRTGGEVLADALLAHGADTIFCIPGESFLAFLDAARERQDRLRVITCRQEGGAAYMAEAYGKLTGRPGLCFVTRAPGACNAAVGLHTGFQDATPMILLIGQTKRSLLGREAYQEVDFRRMFGPLAKHVEEVAEADRLPEAVNRAFAAALGGRPGPVVLVLPQDMLEDATATPDCPPAPLALPYPDPAAIAILRERLATARRPILVAGGSGWSERARTDFLAFAEDWELPVAAAFRRHDLVDCRSPSYAGALGTSLDPELGVRFREADVVVLAGSRVAEVDTQGYTLIASPRPSQFLVQAFPAAEELGRVTAADLPIVAAPPPFATACRALPVPSERPWAEWTRRLHLRAAADARPTGGPGEVDLGEVIRQAAALLPEDAIVCYGAGNYTGWVQRHYPFRRFRTQLAPVNGSMGYAVPAAIAATAISPGRAVVAFAGDGCFLMTAQELATAQRHRLAPVIVVVNNGIYGTIRAHQERAYPGREIATDLTNPDFVAFARSFGAWAERVERTEAFAPAFERALQAERLALLELRMSPEAITSRATLTAIRKAASCRE